MIRAVLRLGDRHVSSAVLLRDALRSARRWQTYALRAAFSAVLMGFFLAAMWGVSKVGREWLDPADLGKAARYLFVSFAVMQVLVASLVAPFGVAAAVIEEREQNTIELLMLTRLQARQILVAKVTARLLLLMTVVLGAMPVLALVTTVGGVSVVEVVAVTVHALVAVVVLGVMGGFFGIFTRSPVVATLAALFYGVLVFALAPALYTTLTGDWHGLAHFSPLYGTAARDWWALLPILTYLPVLSLLLGLGSRFYELRIANANLRRFFEPGSWRVGSLKWIAVALGVSTVALLPPAIVGSWYFALDQIGGGGGSPALWELAVGGISRAVVWAWCVGALVLCTWLYLRVAMDMVLMTDDMLGPGAAIARRVAGPVRVWRNPVAWQSLRGNSWRALGPIIGVWVLVLLAVFQMGLWIIPGGLLAMGGANALGGLVVTIWLGVGTFERERGTGALEILLTTTLDSFSIVLGKALGVAAPTSLVLLVSVPMIALGAPHLHVLYAFGHDAGFGMAALKGIGACLWVGGLWLLVLNGSMFVALALPKPSAGYALGVAGLAIGLVVPTALAALTRGFPLAEEPFRLLVPVLVSHPTLWEMGISLCAMLLASLVLFVVCCVKLRDWGLRHA